MLAIVWSAVPWEADKGTSAHWLVQGGLSFEVLGWCLAQCAIVLAEAMGPTVVPFGDHAGSCGGLRNVCCEGAFEGLFHAVLICLCEEIHAPGDGFLSIRDAGPFPNLHGEDPAFTEYFDKDEDGTGVSDWVTTLGC